MRSRFPFAAALLAILPAPSPAAGARVWEEKLVIPTYELGAPDPNPAWGSRRPVYPYPRLDTLTKRRVEKAWQAVYLENEYLKVTVLPELGGKLYAIFDKIARRDVLYTNHVVKHGIVGIRGAWTSGGIEWNFPDGHTVTTVSPVDYVTRLEPDGSATVTVGDTERIQRMQWAVTIRLRPLWKVVETEVTLNNRRDVPGRYWFWATAAAPAAEDLRFVYPMREAYPHVFWPVFTFPQYKGVDLGLYREVPNALSLFARNSHRDFFGIYYEKSDWGVVHVADHREVVGKKTWTWGTDDAGKIWVEKLTDADGQYVEFQAGRYETQMEHEWLLPHRVEHFTSYWFPVAKLGGAWDEANRNGALRLTWGDGQFGLAVSVNAPFENAVLTLETEGAPVLRETTSLDPGSVRIIKGSNARVAANRPLTFRLTRPDGAELISYRTDLPPDGNPEFRPATRPVADPQVASSAEQAFVAGQIADRESRDAAARASYEEALKRDAGFAPAHIALGVSHYRSGEFDQAAEHLEAALRRNRDAGDAHYYLGLVRRAQGRSLEARRQLLWVVRAGHRESAARYALGEMALAARNTLEAVEHFEEAVRLEPRDLKARAVLAMALRLARRLNEAQETIDAVVRQVPIDYLALSEQSLILRARGREAEATRVCDQVWRLLAREPDAVLELAFDYLAAGQVELAAQVLEVAIARGGAYPMLHYTLGYLAERRGDRAGAAGHYRAGAKSDPALVFPHRLEEIAALEAARRADPQDGRAAYYLGSALASKLRWTGALAAWRDAVRLDAANAVACRNLGWALWRHAEDKDAALAAYEQAMRHAPGDIHLYTETDRLLAAMKATERRVKLLSEAPAAVRAAPPVILALAAAYVDAGRFAEAAPLLDNTQFTAGEGETSALVVFRNAHLGLAEQYKAAGQLEKAAAEVLRAAEYPRNLGVGRSACRSRPGGCPTEPR